MTLHKIFWGGSTKSPRKYAILTPKSQKKFSGEGALPPPQTPPLWGGGQPSLHPTPLGAFGARPWPPTSTPRSAYVHTVVRSHKLGLGEMENDCNLHDPIVLAIFWQKLSKLVET